MASLLLGFPLLVDTLVNLDNAYPSFEGDVPLWIFTVWGDSLFVCDGGHMWIFEIKGHRFQVLERKASPVGLDDMVARNGLIYAFSRGLGKVYVLDPGNHILDSIGIPYRYAGQGLYLFRTGKGIYLDLPGDSSYSILEGETVRDPVGIHFSGNVVMVEVDGRSYRLSNGILSASFVGEDAGGRKYLFLERSNEAGVEVGMGVVDGMRVDTVWFGRMDMEGYVPRPMEVDSRGKIYLLIPTSRGIRFLIWAP